MKKLRIKPSPVMTIFESITSVMIILSIVSIILNYVTNTFISSKNLIKINLFIDLWFVFDFIVRITKAKDKKAYLKMNGWIDLIAISPILEFFFIFPKAVKLFRLLRFGRIFRLLRLLRIFRIFKFLKGLHEDSAFVNKTLMRNAVLVIAIFSALILSIEFVMDYSYKKAVYEEIEKADFKSQSPYELARNVFGQHGYNVLAWSKKGEFFRMDGSEIEQKAIDPYLIKTGYFYFSIYNGIGILIKDKRFILMKNNIMLVLIGFVIILLVLIFFVLGVSMLRDIKLVHLMIDSMEADDFLLLYDEYKQIENQPKNNQSEITLLFEKFTKFLKEKTADEPGL